MGAFKASAPKLVKRKVKLLPDEQIPWPLEVCSESIVQKYNRNIGLFFDDFGLRREGGPVIQKPFKTESATCIVACVQQRQAGQRSCQPVQHSRRSTQIMVRQAGGGCTVLIARSGVEPTQELASASGVFLGVCSKWCLH